MKANNRKRSVLVGLLLAMITLAMLARAEKAKPEIGQWCDGEDGTYYCIGVCEATWGLPGTETWICVSQAMSCCWFGWNW